MKRDLDGYWTHVESNAPAESFAYGYMIDGAGPFPDPASRSQPDGVHGLSSVPPAFRAAVESWVAPPFRDLVLYELHVGTFTPEGTFAGASQELARLARLGVNAVEVMPVGSFAGSRGWGYDGTAIWAPFEGYGGVEGLGGFVREAHRQGIAVILDVVYNHFGPDGNYTGLYADEYVVAGSETPWGPALNFDGLRSPDVRRFFIENAVHWLTEYGIDGLRLDATHAIADASERHFLAEFSAACREAVGERTIYLIAETHENDPKYVRGVDAGGYGFDAVWADDFHHAARTAVGADHEGYYAAFDGLSSLRTVVARGWLYEGQFDPATDGPRGHAPELERSGSLVFCLQNHDQVGNRAFGERLTRTASASSVRALAMLLLLHPATPLLFQGQEYQSTRPFLYFTDHGPELSDAIRNGRRNEFSRFSSFGSATLREAIPDPQAIETFRQSVLDYEREADPWARLVESYYAGLISLRMSDPVLRAFRLDKLPIEADLNEECLTVRFACDEGTLVLVMNLGREVAEVGVRGEVVVNSDDAAWGGFGRSAERLAGGVRVPSETAVLLSVAER